ncbi:cation-transporting P-type ATPase [Pokkaliibacter plantistimulans]|uniref:cation-transporting P-type ATPase n=1 Tax=Pokkaliibacter plantistimulans TaxID=1635171 RepID=UPI000D75075A|nr:cation-transporting P-type ATPase [Pokkaliibacter plantistimulans]
METISKPRPQAGITAAPPSSVTGASGQPLWHALDADTALQQLHSQRSGLGHSDAAERLQQYGANVLTPPATDSMFKRFLLQFHNVLIYVLLAAAVVSVGLGHWIDGSVIFAVVLINALFGLLQEGKAEKALASIRTLLHITTAVLRGGQRESVDAEQLVPGDIVLLESGDKVPADIRLLDAINLRAQESALTGEANSVSKQAHPVEPLAPLAERSSMLFAGTLITQGRARGVVVSTGDHTELGQIGTLLRDVETLSTPLTRQMAQLGRTLTLAILAITLLVFLFGWLWRDYPLSELFMSSVGLAVAAIPEGLPAIITITLAIGVQRMALRNAIIRRLPAVETLGAVSVICSDKTGTLTRNEMTVQSVCLQEGQIDVSGLGYQGEGEFSLNGQPLSATQLLEVQHLALAALLCNDARFDTSAAPWRLHGDPTEGALLALAAKAGWEHGDCLALHPRTNEIPFESEHRYMATLHHPRSQDDDLSEAVLLPRLLVKGAPERVLAMCSQVRSSQGHQALDTDSWKRAVERLAARGQRVLAIAEKPLPEDHPKAELDHGHLTGLTLLGLVGIADPLREEVRKAVAECHAAGIRVVMITGDHASTAFAIGSELQLGDEHQVLTGSMLDQLSDAELEKLIDDTRVVARASPEHKLRLIQALQAKGRIVAMTGDGVNDAPALKRADVGVAMGLKGTEAAKEAAEMVLADDNFSSIRDAVVEGRTVYDNLRKALVFILPTNGGEALVLIAAILLGITLPMTPVQILWVNMITAVTLSLALAFEQSEAGLMQRPPRPAGETLLNRFLIWRVTLVSVLLATASLLLFQLALHQYNDLALARTVAVNALVAGEATYLLNCRSLQQSTLSWRSWTGNPYVLLSIGVLIVVQLLFTYLPLMQTLFGTVAMPLSLWPETLAAGVAVYLLVEAEKWLSQRLADR